MPAFANSQNLVEVEEIKESTVILKDGGLRQILMVSGVNFALRSEEEQNAISAAYANFLNSIDFGVEIIVHSRKINIERYLANLEKRAEEERSPLLQSQIKEYAAFIKKFVQEGAIMSKSFFIVVPWHGVGLPSASGAMSLLPFGKKKDAAAEKEKAEAAKTVSFTENLQQLSQRVAQVVDGISTTGLDVVLLNDEQLVELFYNFYNPETTEKENINLPPQK
jgi:type IV secretory pathway VirB4 component